MSKTNLNLFNDPVRLMALLGTADRLRDLEDPSDEIQGLANVQDKAFEILKDNCDGSDKISSDRSLTSKGKADQKSKLAGRDIVRLSRLRDSTAWKKAASRVEEIKERADTHLSCRESHRSALLDPAKETRSFLVQSAADPLEIARLIDEGMTDDRPDEIPLLAITTAPRLIQRALLSQDDLERLKKTWVLIFMASENTELQGLELAIDVVNRTIEAFVREIGRDLQPRDRSVEGQEDVLEAAGAPVSAA